MTADLRAFGLAVGHATDSEGATGLTVIRGNDGPLRAGAAIFGRATGTRELHTLAPDHLVDRIDAVMLTGGSAYGLDAAAGVMRWMEERGRGFQVAGGVVPIVPAAVVFDLMPLGRFDARPTPAMAYEACNGASSTDIAQGSVGVGTGATVGKIAGAESAMKGGFGCAVKGSGGWRVAAMAVVNALGDVRDGTGHIIAGARTPGIARGGAPAFLDATRVLAERGTGIRNTRIDDAVGVNTTLCVVATNSPLGRGDLTQLARASGAALFRRITPAGTSVDGDVVFALSPVGAFTPLGADATVLEAIAVTALESAIEQAVRSARGREDIPGLADDA